MRTFKYWVQDAVDSLGDSVQWVLLALWAGFCVWVATMVGVGIGFAVFFGVPVVLLFIILWLGMSPSGL